jgi:hypothetical protein
MHSRGVVVLVGVPILVQQLGRRSLTKVTSASASTQSFDSGAMTTREVVGHGFSGLASCINLTRWNVVTRTRHIGGG